MVVAKSGPDGLPPPAAVENAFQAVFAVGHLVCQVFYVELPEGPVAHGGSDERHIQLWPAVGADVRWPPQDSFPDEDELQTESRRTPEGIAPPLT